MSSFTENYEHKHQEHLADLQKKEEEMKQMFVVRVKEKESELKDAEREVRHSEQYTGLKPSRTAKLNFDSKNSLYFAVPS